MAIADRLKYARERAGLSQTQVKDRTEIGESSLSEFENGKREPSLSQLQKLAEIYHRSISFLLAEEPLSTEPTVLWRRRPAEKADELEARFLRLCEQYHNLEVWCDERAPACLPSALGDPNRYRYSDADELAKRTRRDLQLGERPGQTLLRVLEELCGVKIFHLSFEPLGSAASLVSNAWGAAVLLNAKHTHWHRNFDLAHELFHLLTWNIFHGNESVSEVQPSDQEEKLANRFAACLLMPTESFGSAVTARVRDNVISFEALYDIAREFDVSIDAVMWRFHFLHRTPEDSEKTKQDIERLKRSVLLLAERNAGEPPERPARYEALAVTALRRGEVSIGRFAEYMGISRQAATRYIEQESPDSEEIPVTLA